MEYTLLCLIILCSVVATSGQKCPPPCYCKGNFEVYCNHTGISEIPGGIPKETTILDLGGNKIKKITKSSLDGLINLSSLGLEESEFTGDEIEPGALNLPNLTIVDLSFNRYMRVPPNLSKTMTRMYFMNNPIEVVDHSSFDEYGNLKYFDMSNCNIRSIKPHAFDALINIDTIYIAFTPLSSDGLPDGVFLHNRKLRLLSLRFNHLTRVTKNLPDSLQYIEYIGNDIKVLPSHAFPSPPPNLLYLGFWEGKVTTIEDFAFAGLSHVTTLDLNENKLNFPIRNNTFSGLTSLGGLILYDNQIPAIDVGALHDLSNLGTLWLSGNNLTTLEEGVLDDVPHLNMLYIDFNPWYCDCNLRWLREKMDSTSIIQDPHLIVCHGPDKISGKAWDALKPTDFVC